MKKSDYSAVFEQAKKISTSHFTLLFRENTIGHARLGLVFSKKTIAKAHDRNRLKRLLREAFRLRKDLKSVDIVVLTKRGVDKTMRSSLVDQLDKTWLKLSV